MIRQHDSRPAAPGRPGKTLVAFALLLPLLLGMVGLGIDSGLLFAAYRQTQNAADAAAMAAALDLLNGQTAATAKSSGASYVQSYNNMANATVTINIPPTGGPYAGVSTYAEAIVSYSYSTSFIQLLGVNQGQGVTARAVAGYHLVAQPAGVITLQQNPPGISGLSVSGTAALIVDGPVIDNATNLLAALNISGSPTFYATNVSVSGGATGASLVQNILSGALSPLTQNTGINYADPLATLPVPTTANGVVNNYYGVNGSTLQGGYSSPQSVSISDQTAITLQPGIYGSININGGTNVTFASGIYVIAGGGLSISGTSTVSTAGGGVMFYNTDSNYNPITGAVGPSPNFGSVTITGGSGVNLSGLTSSTSPFNGMFMFQDRSNSRTLNVTGNSAQPYTGTYYAPIANLTATGDSTFNNSQFVVGSMTVTGNTTVTVNPPSLSSSSNVVFLVE